MVYLFLADGFEEIEALTPVDYLRRSKVEVKTVSVSDSRQVVGSHRIPVQADLLLSQVDLSQAEMIVLPGGMPGTLHLEDCQPLQEILSQAEQNGIWVAAICAAPSILGHRGFLKGRKATCYTGFETELDGAEYTGEPVEIDGKFITARGAGVANQFAFQLVEVLKGKEAAETLKAGILWQQ